MSRTAVRPAKRVSPTRRMVVLNRRQSRSKVFATRRARLVDTVTKLREELDQPAANSVWISYDKSLTRELLKNMTRTPAFLGDAIFLHDLSLKSIAALAGYFRHFAFAGDGSFLPPEELAEVLTAENRSDLFIGGFVDEATKTMTLWRGNLESLTVPLTAFPKSGDGTKPDLSKFAITDYGQTIQLGPYEAAADAILYEYDANYRRRVKKKRLASDPSLGASIRRLRKQRGLSREDFAPAIASRTLARIENGQVQSIQKRTLQALADRLGVLAEELGSF